MPPGTPFRETFRLEVMERAQALPSFAEAYERIVVPAIFTRYARDLIERARPIGPSARILDLGCGTGIVGRQLRERLGGAARIAGLDLHAGMLAVARDRAPDVDWREGDATAMPFEDHGFDLVLCQQMLQFVPDRAAAVREVRRVLAPGGRFLASAWRAADEQPLFQVLGPIARRHFGPADDKRTSFGDAGALRALLADAGFADVRVETVSLVEEWAEMPLRLHVFAANHDVAGIAPDELERRFAAFEAEARAALAPFAMPTGGYAVRSHTNVATAAVASS